ncbi:MAG TPA: alpha/beta hydrolase [Chitinophagaceae bacterium]|nr:alpha/beta hydrolase [Chitinophagaceae bacterium]
MTRLLFSVILCLAVTGSLFAQAPYTPFKGKVQSIQLSTGVSLQYAEKGNANGIPVILLHGYTDSWHSFETTLPFLPERMHVFALSQRGHGDSDKPGGNYHPKDFAADIADFIKKKNLGQVVIVGHSMGGVIAQQFAITYPKLTRALVVISSDIAMNNNPGMPEFHEEVKKLRDPISPEFADGFQSSTVFKPVDPAFHKIAVRESLKMPAHVWKQVAEGFLSVDFRKEIAGIQKPVLILWGDKDGICSRAGQQLMSQTIWNSRLIIYEETGHALHWEQPERFANDLVKFISENVTTIPSK